MKCFVTVNGGSGFVGSNLIHELLAQGHRVKALLRPNADLRPLAGAQYGRRVTLEDMSDHCIAPPRDGRVRLVLSTPPPVIICGCGRLPARMYDTNVTGTRNVLEAAGKAGCSRIVYTSTAWQHRLEPYSKIPVLKPSNRPMSTQVESSAAITDFEMVR